MDGTSLSAYAEQSNCAELRHKHESAAMYARRPTPGVIIVVPPWPRSGSANLFASQAQAYAALGFRVMMLVGPTSPRHRSQNDRLWADVMSPMRYDGVDVLDFCRNRGGHGFFRSRSFFQWVQGGFDTALEIAARFSSSADWPPSLYSFLGQYEVQVVHVNHAFELLLGTRLRHYLRQRHGLTPKIFCDTHDVQAEVWHRRGERNPFAMQSDSYLSMFAAEVKLLRSADILVHCSEADMSIFQRSMPDLRHDLCLPSLVPNVESALLQIDHSRWPKRFDFLYVGNNNYANLQTLRWLLSDVFPRVREEFHNVRFAILGKVCDGLRDQRPELYRKFRESFIGEVPEIDVYYGLARYVLVPSLGGTGCSIKLIEALCAGNSLLGTPDTLRGIPSPIKTKLQHLVCDGAAALARTMGEVLATGVGGLTSGRDIYIEHFGRNSFMDNTRFRVMSR